MKICKNAIIQTVDPNKMTCSLSPEEVARVKGQGCLWDKRTPDSFNVRVLTVNGKLTTEKLTAIAQAAQQFGSGQAAMTSRLTIEIQGVPYANIQPMQEFLAQHGLQTGGTRPGRAEYYVSDRVEDFERIASLFLQEDLHHEARRIDIEQY